MTTLIETQDLTKRFDTLIAVEGVSLRVREGEVLALLGPNGAGKTTTIRMLASILKPTRGEARIAGHDVVSNASQVRREVGLLTEHHGLYTRMRPWAYLRFFGHIYGVSDERLDRRIDELVQRFGLEAALELRLGQFSRGMRQKLALARALLHDPPVLLLDEPTSAMDPASARLVRESIANLRSSKRAIVVCTHNLAEAESLADSIAIIRRGRIVAQGAPSSLKQALLGDPIMEVRLASPLNGDVDALPRGLVPIAFGPDWIRYRTAQPNVTNPRVIEALGRAGLPIVTLTEVGRSLEEVYLQVIEAEIRAESGRSEAAA